MMSSSYLLNSGRTADAGEESSVQCDYVIIFDAASPKEGTAAVVADYNRLKERLESAGLEVTSRVGAPKTNELLLFVRAQDERLRAELAAEALNDWMHDVYSKEGAVPRNAKDFEGVAITASERLRLAYNLITGLPERHSQSAGPCAGVIPGAEAFTRVKSIFPPHDSNFNKQWLKRWTSTSYFLSIPESELSTVKDHFGANIALYFEFLRFYFVALAFPTVTGALFWVTGQSYHPLYSFLLVLWAVIFVETWRIRERVLSVRWGTYRCGVVARKRTQFTGNVQGIDPLTGKPKQVQAWYAREARLLSSVPVLLAFAAFLFAVISAIFATEVLINEVYEGTGKQYLSLLPTILFAGLVPQVVALWQKTAHRLTEFENHEHADSFDRALTLKMFCLNAISAFGSLTLTAFVYIPFGSLIVPRVLSVISTKEAIAADAKSGHAFARAFSINSKKLLNTLFALNTTTQAIGTATETIVPVLTRMATNKIQDGKKDSTKSHSSDSPAEAAFLKRIREEAALPQYETFGDYAEMSQQFGYVTLWSAIWPLVPFTAIVNNFFELRGDAFKICANNRRPVPSRVETIGPWLETLGFMTWLAAFTNASLTYMYRPQHSAVATQLSSVTAKAVNGTANAFGVSPPFNGTSDPFFATRMYAASLETTNPWQTIRSTLFTALLIGLASEHAYILVRAGVRRILDEAFWKPSPERAEVAKCEGRMKNHVLSALDIQQPQAAVAQRNAKEALTSSDDFFNGNDRGVEEIQNMTKTQ